MEIPVIDPDVPVVREVFQDQKHLLLADQSGDDFLDLVRKIMDEPDFASSIARQGQELVLGYYLWKHNAERLVEFLQQQSEDLRDK